MHVEHAGGGGPVTKEIKIIPATSNPTTAKTNTTQTTSKNNTSASSSKPASTAGSSLSGVDKNLYSSLQKNFQKSAQLMEAESYLDQLTKAGYTSRYADEIAALTDQYLNRGPFKYDMNADALFRVARDQAVQSGKMAMQDTMANAAALTGGYGNSWAGTAGNQAYQAYLTQLYNNVPEYAQMAYDQYAQEGNEMLSKASLLMDQDETDYARWYQNYLNHYNAAQDLYNKEYGVYSDDLSRNFNLAQMKNSDYWNDQENQRAWANYELNKANAEWSQYMDTVSLLNSSSESGYKTPTADMYDGAKAAYNNGGEKGLTEFLEKYSEYNVEELYRFATEYGNAMTGEINKKRKALGLDPLEGTADVSAALAPESVDPWWFLKRIGRSGEF